MSGSPRHLNVTRHGNGNRMWTLRYLTDAKVCVVLLEHSKGSRERPRRSQSSCHSMMNRDRRDNRSHRLKSTLEELLKEVRSEEVNVMQRGQLTRNRNENHANSRGHGCNMQGRSRKNEEGRWEGITCVISNFRDYNEMCIKHDRSIITKCSAEQWTWKEEKALTYLISYEPIVQDIRQQHISLRRFGIYGERRWEFHSQWPYLPIEYVHESVPLRRRPRYCDGYLHRAHPYWVLTWKAAAHRICSLGFWRNFWKYSKENWYCSAISAWMRELL